MSKQKAAPEKTLQEPRAVQRLNRLSESAHSGIVRAQSRVRLSLVYRIALHYCGELARTLLLWVFLLTVGFGVGEGIRLQGLTRRVAECPPDAGNGYTQMVLQDSRAEAVWYANEEAPTVWQRIGLFFGSGFPGKVGFYGSAARGGQTHIILDIGAEWKALLCLLIAAALADLLRMIYFWRKAKRLNKSVLEPIRSITSMAETLSAANLSNRINVANTKTELQELAVVINSMLDRLEQSYNSQKQFVSDVSHELRTPIAVIQGYADMLQRWGKEDPEVLSESLNAISSETAAMKDLVENLLFLARHDKKSLLLEKSVFDPCEVAGEVQREAAMVHTNHVFSLEPEDHCALNADRNMVKQVLRILVDNAVKYSGEGTRVTLGVRRDGARCLLTVADRGSGIPAEELPKIFDRFYRADAARHSETGGHGLGLSIARIIVVSHGGKLRVRSKVGVGTVFEIELPCAEAAPAASPANTATEG